MKEINVTETIWRDLGEINFGISDRRTYSSCFTFRNPEIKKMRDFITNTLFECCISM